LTLPLMTVPAIAAQTVGELPSVVGLSSASLPQDMLVFDRRGNLLADVGDQGDHRVVVPLSYISPNVINATIAVEDHTFYSNSGVDFGAIVRAALADYSHHGIKQGGSTISQQLVKQLFIGPNPDNSIHRKAKEAALALELNRGYSKQQILEMYLNTIFYGSQTYGIEAAAHSYFQTNAHDLTLAQASMLAGLPQAPTQYNPLINLPAAKARQLTVLTTMVDYHFITQTEADAALVSMDPKTGEILAMVGGNDYNRPGGWINMADTPREPGSTFKIYTYTAAIERRKFNMITPVLDATLVFPTWGGVSGFEHYIPLNYDLH